MPDYIMRDYRMTAGVAAGLNLESKSASIRRSRNLNRKH